MRTTRINPTSITSGFQRMLLFGAAAVFSVVIGFGAQAFASTFAAPNATNTVTSAKHEDPQERINERVEKMTKKLGLTTEQAAAIKNVFETNQPKMKADHEALKKASDANKAAAKAQMVADRQSEMSEIRALLNPEQQAKFDAFAAKHQKHD